ncbi:unnamed protein product [Schistosoma rodhaini]|nr:unnamed protein product [Schistosoma rodhaini]
MIKNTILFLLFTLLQLFVYEFIENDSNWRKQMIINEIKGLQRSLQKNMELIRSYDRRIKLLIDVQCLVNMLYNEYNHDLMRELVNVVDDIEQKYNITYPKSRTWKECFTYKTKIYRYLTTEYNLKICDKLKEYDEHDTDVLSIWTRIQHTHISHFNLDLFKYRFLSELAKIVNN